jgi:hypothetical protein
MADAIVVMGACVEGV